MKAKTILLSALALSVFGCAQVGDKVGVADKPEPQMQAVLTQLKNLGVKPVAELTPEQARVQPTPADAVKAVLKEQGKSTEPMPVGKIENGAIRGPAGQIPVRIYWPSQGSSPFPVVHYIHGGGWVIANLDTYDASARAIANAANAIVVSSHYRQAPEHPFPAAHEDSFTAYQWLVANAGKLGGDPNRIAVMGESAGGNMAAAITLLAREHGLPMPVHQVLVYPVANYGFDTPSYQQNANAQPLSKDGMQWFFKHYLTDPKQGQDPLISLVDAKNLKGLPPTTIITAEIDPLRSEGKRYADLLQQAGVPVDYKNYDGVTHEFFGMGAVVDKAKQAVGQAAVGLKSSFEKAGAAGRAAPQ
ncbi:MAG: alpha/beta hydrolase [Burkholderiales bacterium]